MKRVSDEGTQWYGRDLPAGWRYLRFRHVATIRNGQVDPTLREYRGLPLFAPNHIESATGRLLAVDSAETQGAESGKYLVDAGDVLYSKIRPGLRKVARAPTAGLCSADVYPVKPRTGVEPRFLLWVMLSEGFSAYSLLESDRVAMPKINREALAECPVPIPPSTVQPVLADFLDRKTAAIDALIEKKERLIALLQEKRQALITQAVTKGLDPSVPMKDSGIEWLGEVPAHWGVGSLKRWWQVLDCKHRTVAFTDDGFPVVSIGEVHGIEVDLTHAKRTSRSEYMEMIAGGRRPRVGDIIYSRNATVGEAALVTTEQPFCMGQDVSLIRSNVGDPQYLVFLLRSPAVLRQLDVAMIGATFKRINVGAINRLLVLSPPLAEQRAIAERCAWVYRHIGRLIDQVMLSLRGLREYRQALITAAVTGQIDVTKEAA